MNAKRKRLLNITLLYWLLLLYIVAALVFWYLELEEQNLQMISHRISELVHDDPSYPEKLQALWSEKQRKSAQYLGEGVVFLAVIIIGAVFMYRAVRRQFALQRQQENLMMAITHELKTPIAVAKLNLETLQRHQLDETKRQKLIQMTLQETNRLNALAGNILVSAQLEEGKSFAREEIDFSDLVKNSLSEFSNRHPDRTWNVSLQEDTELRGDPLLLTILVNNLLENAIKYSPPGSPVGCSLQKAGGQVVLRISDAGAGIPQTEKGRIFRKFYRLGSEQTRTTKGTGLGLYLCRKIAADHHAHIKVTDNTPHGSVFTVKFEKPAH